MEMRSDYPRQLRRRALTQVGWHLCKASRLFLSSPSSRLLRAFRSFRHLHLQHTSLSLRHLACALKSCSSMACGRPPSTTTTLPPLQEISDAQMTRSFSMLCIGSTLAPLRPLGATMGAHLPSPHSLEEGRLCTKVAWALMRARTAAVRCLHGPQCHVAAHPCTCRLQPRPLRPCRASVQGASGSFLAAGSVALRRKALATVLGP